MITVEGKQYRQYYVSQNGQIVSFIIEGNGAAQTIFTGQSTKIFEEKNDAPFATVIMSPDESIKVRMIKANTTQLNGIFDFQVARYRQQQNNDPFDFPRYSRLNVTFTPLTTPCNLNASPSTVQLGTVYLHQIPNPGNAHTAVPVTMQFNNCPVGYNSIRYRFEAFPTPGNFDANGVLPVMPPSSATGVGVQVLQGSSGTTPIAFNIANVNYTLSEYASSPGQTTYNVPLRARIIRRSANATAGSVHAQMRMVVQYN